MSDLQSFDVVIIGAGHNGLTCAAYLAARRARDVVVLEKNDVVGGAAVTEEFHPGFRNSVAAYTVSLLNPKVIADLELSRHGLRIVERPAANFWPVDDTRFLLMRGGLRERQAAVAASRRATPSGCRPTTRRSSAQPTCCAISCCARRPTPAAASSSLSKGGGRRARRARARLSPTSACCSISSRKSAADFLDRWFESEVVKGAFAFDGIVGNYASPYDAGHRLRAAAPLLRRGERQARRLGPRARRHGRHHAGAWRAAARARGAHDPHRRARARGC